MYKYTLREPASNLFRLHLSRNLPYLSKRFKPRSGDRPLRRTPISSAATLIADTVHTLESAAWLHGHTLICSSEQHYLFIHSKKRIAMGLFSSIMGNAGVIESEKLQSDYGQLLADGESIEVGFAVFRDTFIFTSKRLILVDVQGMTGKKIEYLSIPYSKITKFSIETAGRFDLDAELKLWIGSDPMPLQKKFDKKVNIYDLQRVLANQVLG